MLCRVDVKGSWRRLAPVEEGDGARDASFLVSAGSPEAAAMTGPQLFAAKAAESGARVGACEVSAAPLDATA